MQIQTFWEIREDMSISNKGLGRSLISSTTSRLFHYTVVVQSLNAKQSLGGGHMTLERLLFCCIESKFKSENPSGKEAT